MPMASEKKCPHCGQWTEWNVSMEDRCQHCNEYLMARERADDEARVERIRKDKEKFMFTVKPTDGPLMRIARRVGYVFYVIYIAILSLITWILFWLPG